MIGGFKSGFKGGRKKKAGAKKLYENRKGVFCAKNNNYIVYTGNPSLDSNHN